MKQNMTQKLRQKKNKVKFNKKKSTLSYVKQRNKDKPQNKWDYL